MRVKLIAYEPPNKKADTPVVSSSDYAALLNLAEAKLETISGQCDHLRIRVVELEAKLIDLEVKLCDERDEHLSLLMAAGGSDAESLQEFRARVAVMAAERDRFREALEDLAEGDCVYGDSCPDPGTRHGSCAPCLARRALEKV
jgi:hypothetical protein